jgi:Dockerin type I domain
MRKLYQWASPWPVSSRILGFEYLLTSLRHLSMPQLLPVVRALTLLLGLAFGFSAQAGAQYTLNTTDPTCQNKLDGIIRLTGLTPGQSYPLTITSTGTPLNSATYAANTSGQIVFSNCAAGRYTFSVLGQVPSVRSDTLYNLTSPIGAVSPGACIGERIWINPFHNDESSVVFPFNTGNQGVSSNTTYLGNGNSILGAGLTSSGLVPACSNSGLQTSGYSATTNANTAFAAGDYIEFTVPVNTLKYDLTCVEFTLNRNANGPAQFAVYFDGAFANAGTVTQGVCTVRSWVGARTFAPGETIKVQIVGFDAAQTTGTMLVDSVVFKSALKYNFYADASLTNLVAASVDSFQTPVLGAGPLNYWIEPFADASTSTDCFGEPLLFSISASVKPTPTISVAPNLLICQDGVNMATVSQTTSTETYQWNIGSTTRTISTIPNNNVGEHTYIVLVTNGTCIDSARVTFTVLPPVPVVITGATQVCAGESTTLTASGANTYVWSTGATTASITVTPVAGALYTVTATDTQNNGCTATKTVSISYLTPQPISIAAPVTNACAGSTVVISASGGVSYVWSANAGSVTTPTATVLSSGTYTVTGTDAAGCTSTATRVLTPIAGPSVTLTTSVASICAGQSAILTATGGGTYAWSNGPTVGVQTVKPLVTTAYTVTVTGTNGCTATATGSVDVRAIPKPVITIVPPQCVNGNDGKINVSLLSGGPISTYTWMTISGSGIVAGQANQNALTAGTYMLILSNTASCDTTLTLVVPVALGNNDTTAPRIKCDSAQVFCSMGGLTPQQMATLGVPGLIPTATDNCDLSPDISVLQIAAPIDVACGDLLNGRANISYAIDYLYTAKDDSGNASSCTSRIYYQRITPSQIVYPTAKTFDCINATTQIGVTGVPTHTAFGTAFPLFPNAGFCELKFDTTDQRIQICKGSYNLVRTWKLFDQCALTNTNTTQIISVVDTNKPSFTCPPSVTVSTDAQTCTRNYDLPDIKIEDACSSIKSFQATWSLTSGMPMALQGNLVTFNGNNLWAPDTLGTMGTAMDLPLGTTHFNYKVVDDCNNDSTCTFSVTVADLIKPLPICKSAGIQISLNSSEVTVPATLFNGGSTDNCASNVYFKARRMDASSCQANNQFFDKVSFCCSDKGQTVAVILRVYDIPVASGPLALTFLDDHAAECMTTVTIADKLKPTCPAPQDYVINCEAFDPTLWAYDTLIALDNCGPLTYNSSVNYNGFNAQCKEGTIIRTFTATDAGGLSCQATQSIQVKHKQDYSIRFPNDVILNTCNGTPVSAAPILYNADCELANATAIKDDTLTLSIGACYEIYRTWRVINLCTYDANRPCTVVPNPNPAMMPADPTNLAGPIVAPAGATIPSTIINIMPGVAATNFTQYWSADANCYEYKQRIKVSDQVPPTFVSCPTKPDTINDLTANDPLLWNNMLLWDNLHQTHNLGEAAINLSTAATDACSGSQMTFSYQLFLDLDGNGSMETVVNSNTPPTPGTVRYDNASTPNFSGGSERIFDQRNIPVSQKYTWTIQQSIVGANMTAQVRWSAQSNPNSFVTPQLPYGTHKIKWFAIDACGNQTVCESMFTIRDNKAPTGYVYAGISSNIMPSGMAIFNLSTLMSQLPIDNMTDSNKIQVSLQVAPAGTTFPLDANGNPITQVTITCAQLQPNGNVPLIIWMRDLAGNTSTINVIVRVVDNNLVCPILPVPGTTNKLSIAGSLDAKDNAGVSFGVEGVMVNLTGSHPTQTATSATLMTDANGKYQFGSAVPAGGDYMINAHKNTDLLNGVNILDVLNMQRHILGISPLTTPYKIIAADINKSGSVTSTDMVELRKLILGAYTTLPNNTSWRFVDKNYQFTQPFNPFADNFNEYLSYQNLLNNQTDACFVAVKVGDLNQSATFNTAQAKDRTAQSTLYIEANERSIVQGEVFDVPMQLSDVVAAYQMTLNYDGLTLEEVISTDNQLKQDHFVVFNEQSAITFATAPQNQSGFTLRFRAQRSGTLSQMIQINSRITAAMASGLAGETLQVEARFTGKNTEVLPFVVYQSTPNPMRNNTTIGFHLPEAGAATLTITDELGRTIHTQKSQFGAGYQAFDVQRNHLTYSGLYFYTIKSGSQTATMRMIVSE